MGDDLHRTLIARASRAGMSLQEYLRGESKDAASAPTLNEVLDRMEARKRAGGRGFVADSSSVMALLLGTSVDADYPSAARVLTSEQTVVPSNAPDEATHTVRSRARDPVGSFDERVWQLRANVTPYDAWYVALAEALDVPLATLDLRLATAPGPRCRFLTP